MPLRHSREGGNGEETSGARASALVMPGRRRGYPPAANAAPAALDCRVKPGNDDEVTPLRPSLRSGRTTAQQMRMTCCGNNLSLVGMTIVRDRQLSWTCRLAEGQSNVVVIAILIEAVENTKMSGASFHSRTYNIGALLGRSSFPDYLVQNVVVPEFQRGFSWTKQHVATFWDDINEFHNQLNKTNSSNQYFLGPIVIIPLNDGISLLDGQQRLATTTIALSVIRDIARETVAQPGGDLGRDIQRDFIQLDDESDEFAIRLGSVDKDFFRDTVQIDGNATVKNPQLRSHRLIHQAQSFLKLEVNKNISNLSDGNKINYLKEIKRTLTQRIKLVVIEVHSEEEAFLIFETLNDRGLRLQVPDLLLNFLLRHGKSQRNRRTIRNLWDKNTESLAHRQVSHFLRHMWISKYGDVKSQSLYREMRKLIEARSISALNFAKECSAECESYVDIINLNPSALGTACDDVSAILKSINAQKTLPLLLSGLECLHRTEFKKLCRDVLAFLIRHDVIANWNPAESESLLFEMSRNIRSGKEAGQTSKKMLQSLKHSLRKHDPGKLDTSKNLPESPLI